MKKSKKCDCGSGKGSDKCCETKGKKSSGGCCGTC